MTTLLYLLAWIMVGVLVITSHDIYENNWTLYVPVMAALGVL